MGVKGLWKLIEPVGRPTKLEAMEGKALAIDSSIWIYQFQATMRDKEGRGLVNAHVLGFLRRICKLLFYGIKPVFVFDGGAPPLKRATISERKRKKAGAAVSHAQIAERLLAAQMRRQAVADAEERSSKDDNTRRSAIEPVSVDSNTVYLEDLDDPNFTSPSKQPAQVPKESPSSAQKKKNKWHDYDPYRLPEVDENVLTKATSSTAPDPRLATEEELRQFIETMKPSDFDVTSPEFRALPTEVQYEIIGDMRLKSRQTSYKRLQSMIQTSKSPMDFSMAQIKGLKQRNNLTQQLLTTTDTIGKAHIEIPIRIASERNREYVLVQNHGPEGGWVLGIRDTGTAANPIKVDADPTPIENVAYDSDDDIEAQSPDRMPLALSSIGQRPQGDARSSYRQINKKPVDSVPLFVPDGDGIGGLEQEEEGGSADLQIAIQESLEEQEAEQMRAAIELSKSESASYGLTPSKRASSSRQILTSPYDLTNEDDDDPLYTPLHKVPSRLGTALTFANTTPQQSAWASHPRSGSSGQSSKAKSFGAPVLLLDPDSATPSKSNRTVALAIDSESEESLEEVEIVESVADDSIKPESALRSNKVSIQGEIDRVSGGDALRMDDGDGDEDDDLEAIEVPAPEGDPPRRSTPNDKGEAAEASHLDSESGEDEDMEVVDVPLPDDPKSQELDSTRHRSPYTSPEDNQRPEPSHPKPEQQLLDQEKAPVISALPGGFKALSSYPVSTISVPEAGPSNHTPSAPQADASLNSEDEWEVVDEDGVDRIVTERDEADWDAAQEINVQEEEGEFARFASQIQGRDLAQVRNEIDEEIRVLHQQRKAAMRDSEDITQQMISQIMVMLRLFGIPYITAPMEAEAQCAELVQLGLVEGIITDDSDVFLFGGTRILKNLFNQSQTVEVFVATDLTRELELEREKLIRLAYLLGSDYVEGLPGVGPVIAMEIILEFPGEAGLFKFKDWWRKVQSGQDQGKELNTFRKRFKKRFRELFLPSDWPNPAVRDAYVHPVVDSSDEPFKWGIPDLDGLREFFRNELSWNQSKIDELLLPIIRKMNQRTQANAMNKQGVLDPFFERGSNGIISAARKRDAYASKRLRQVVADFRKQKTKEQEEGSQGSEDEMQNPPTTRGKKPSGKKRGGKASSRGRGRKRAATTSKSSDEDAVLEVEVVEDASGTSTAPARTLRPRPKKRKTVIEVEPDEGDSSD